MEYVADVDRLNDAARLPAGAGPVAPAGDGIVAEMIRAVAEAPAPPDMKEPLRIVSEWLEAPAWALPAAVAVAVLALAAEAEGIEAHRVRMAEGIQFTDVGSALAMMTDPPLRTE